MTNKKFGFLSSSEDGQKLGNTAKGLIVGCATLIIFGASQLGYDVTTEQVTDVAIQVGTVISTLWTLYGIIKKIVVAKASKK